MPLDRSRFPTGLDSLLALFVALLVLTACMGPRDVSSPRALVSPEPSVQAGQHIIRGRILDELGQPIGGARVRLERWPSLPSLVREHGVPALIHEASLSDTRGQFELAVDHHPAASYRLRVVAGKLGHLSRVLAASSEPQVEDLGDLTMEGKSSVEVSLGFEDPRQLPTDWEVEVRRVEAGALWSNQTVHRARFEKHSGVFYARGLEPGVYEVHIQGPHDLGSLRSSVLCELEQPGMLEVQIDEPSWADQARFTFEAEVPFGRGADEAAIEVRSASGKVLQHRSLEGFSRNEGPFGAFGVILGRGKTATVTLTHPDYEPMERKLRAGYTRTFKLKGSGRIDFSRLDPQSLGTEEPLSQVPLFAMLTYADPEVLENSNGRPVILTRKGTLRELCSEGWSGVSLRDASLSVSGVGVAPMELELAPWGPERLQSVVLDLKPSVSLEGRVVWPSGEPALAAIGLYPQSAQSPNLLVSEERPWSAVFPDQQTVPDADGYFRFDGLAPGGHSLQVEASAEWIHWYPNVVAGAGLETNTLVLAEAGTIRGTLQLPVGHRTTLQCRRQEYAAVGDIYFTLSQDEGLANPRIIEVEGPTAEFEFKALDPGAYELCLGGDRNTIRFGPKGRLLQRVEVGEAEVVNVALDGSGSLGSSIEFIVESSGIPLQDFEVVLERKLIADEVFEGRIRPNMFDRESLRLSEFVQESDRLQFDDVPPGEWNVAVSPGLSGGDCWVWVPESTLDVPFAESMQVNYRIPLEQSEVRLLDREGRPVEPSDQAMLGSYGFDPRGVFSRPFAWRSPSSLPVFPLVLPAGRVTFSLKLQSEKTEGNPDGHLEFETNWPPTEGEVLELSVADGVVPKGRR